MHDSQPVYNVDAGLYERISKFSSFYSGDVDVNPRNVIRTENTGARYVY